MDFALNFALSFISTSSISKWAVKEFGPIIKKGGSSINAIKNKIISRARVAWNSKIAVWFRKKK
jgi:hypothetical protein